MGSNGVPYDGSKKYKSDKNKYKGKGDLFWYNQAKGYGNCSGHYIENNCRC